MSLRSPLSRVLGLGSAGDGVHHWWLQRVTAIAMVPLGIWFVVSLLLVTGSGYEGAVAWLQSPLNGALFIMFVIASFWHSALGLQVVIEDYVHTEWLKVLLLVGVKLAIALSAVLVIMLSLRVFLEV